MAFLFGFGAPGRCRRDLQIEKLGFYSFWAIPLALLACLTKIPGDPGRPVQARPVQDRTMQARPVEPVGLPKMCKNTISQFVNASYASQGPQNQKGRPFSGSVGSGSTYP